MIAAPLTRSFTELVQQLCVRLNERASSLR
jgi:hypothetical protein